MHLCDMQYPVAASVFGLIWIAGRILYFQVMDLMQDSYTWADLRHSFGIVAMLCV